MGKCDIYGNLYYDDCSYCEEMNLDNINLLLNNFYDGRTGETTATAYNFAVTILKRKGLYLFRNEATDIEGRHPTYYVDGEFIYGNFFVARYENGEFMDLTGEDYRYLEDTYDKFKKMNR